MSLGRRGKNNNGQQTGGSANGERSLIKSISNKKEPIKAKHLKTLTHLTWQANSDIGFMFQVMSNKIRKDEGWLAVFKSLILTHFLINEGDTDKILTYLYQEHGVLENAKKFRNARANDFSDAIQSKNIRAYAGYILTKVFSYPTISGDFVRSKDEYISKFRDLKYNVTGNGLLDHVETLQTQIEALLNCSFPADEIDNIITLLVIVDAMALFHLANEGVIRVLSFYFEMERGYASKALEIYKRFVRQTKRTVEMFDVARRLKKTLSIDVPFFKHPPLSLAGSLEEYLNSGDFEVQRVAYKLKKEGKAPPVVQEEKQIVERKVAAVRKVEPPLVDFFSSIDNAVDQHYNQNVNQNQPVYSVYSNDPFGDPFAGPQRQSAGDIFAGGGYNQGQVGGHGGYAQSDGGGQGGYQQSDPGGYNQLQRNQSVGDTYASHPANPFNQYRNPAPQQQAPRSPSMQHQAPHSPLMQQQAPRSPLMQQAQPQPPFTIENVFNSNAVYAPMPSANLDPFANRSDVGASPFSGYSGPAFSAVGSSSGFGGGYTGSSVSQQQSGVSQQQPFGSPNMSAVSQQQPFGSPNMSAQPFGSPNMSYQNSTVSQQQPFGSPNTQQPFGSPNLQHGFPTQSTQQGFGSPNLTQSLNLPPSQGLFGSPNPPPQGLFGSPNPPASQQQFGNNQYPSPQQHATSTLPPSSSSPLLNPSRTPTQHFNNTNAFSHLNPFGAPPQPQAPNPTAGMSLSQIAAYSQQPPQNNVGGQVNPFGEQGQQQGGGENMFSGPGGGYAQGANPFGGNNQGNGQQNRLF